MSSTPELISVYLSGGEKQNLKIAHSEEPAGTDITEFMTLSIGNSLAPGSAC